MGLDSVPDGIRAGESWVVRLTILQPGRTPLEGVEPEVTISKPGTTRTSPPPRRDTPASTARAWCSRPPGAGATWIGPLAAALLAAGAAFAIVTITDDDEGPRPRATMIAGRGDSTSGGAIFARMGCGSCHHLSAAGSSGEIGPDLDQRLPAHDRASLIAVITDSDRSGDFVGMPEDFGRRMNATELNALVGFLLAAGGEAAAGGGR